MAVIHLDGRVAPHFLAKQVFVVLGGCRNRRQRSLVILDPGNSPIISYSAHARRREQLSQFEEFNQSTARHVTGSVVSLTGQSASFSISNQIRSKGVIQLPFSHQTLVLLEVEITKGIHG